MTQLTTSVYRDIMHSYRSTFAGHDRSGNEFERTYALVSGGISREDGYQKRLIRYAESTIDLRDSIHGRLRQS